MSAEAVTYFGRVARAVKLNPNARAVFQHLAWSHSHLKPNSLRMSMEDIGWNIGMLPSTVHRSIHELIDLGVLKDEPRKAKRDKTAYTFPTDWDIEGSGEQYLAGIRALGKAKRKVKECKEQRRSEQAKDADRLGPKRQVAKCRSFEIFYRRCWATGGQARPNPFIGAHVERGKPVVLPLGKRAARRADGAAGTGCWRKRAQRAPAFCNGVDRG